jgi:hypothetical protein
MTTFQEDKKFEILKLRYDDQVTLLRKLTDVDLQVFGGYLTIALAFGSWASQHPPTAFLSTIGLMVIATVLAGSASMLLFFNFKRRIEIVGTVKNLNEAFGYEVIGLFIEAKKINANTVFRPWCDVYFVAIWSVFIGICLILWS